MYLAAAEAPTAGGAALNDILIALALSSVYFLITGTLVIRERILGKRTFVGRALDAAGDKIGMPGWAAVPFIVMPPVLLTAGFGVYWDVPLHMQRGRDDGAFANPSHFPIFLVLMGLLHIGLIIMAMARDPLPARTLRLAKDWRVPYSSVILTLAGFIGVLGFPLDDLWHRIFGQDVTEWGPTHVLMIGGAITSPIALPILLVEARQAGARLLEGRAFRWLMSLAIGLCIVPMAFLMEFDLGVPQFPASTQGIIFSFVLAWTCIANRLWFGKGGALLVAGLWQFAHWFLVAVIAPLPGVLTIDFLTSIPIALLVEVAALALAVDRRTTRVLPFALVAGALAGSLGYYLEWWWSKEFMPPPQPFNAEALPYLLTTSTIAGLAGALVAVWMFRRLQDITADTDPGSALPLLPQAFRWYGLAGFVTFVALMALCAPPLAGEAREVEVSYSDVTTGSTDCTTYQDQCLAEVTVRFLGEDPVPDATWFYALAWQGQPREAVEPTEEIPTDPEADVPGLVRSRLVATGNPGEYRVEHKLPLYGQWKALIRIHEGTHDMMAWALYMPDDPAIESERGREIRVLSGETATSTYEPHLLQRERKDSVPAWVYAAGNYVVISLWVLVLLAFGHCYNRAASGGSTATRTTREKVDA